MYKIFINLVLIFCFAALAFSQKNDLNYSKIFIPFDAETNFKTLNKNNIFIDHANKFSNGIETILDNREIETLSNANITYKIIIEDYVKNFQNINEKALKNVAQQKTTSINNFNFGFGSHAGYYSPTEVENILDSIALLFPNIASTPFTIGYTYEGRKINAIKISDHVNIDESLTEPVVYFDGMHHAREPLSMSMNIYYLFWLVQNYGTDSLATFLVNNREIYFVPIVNVDGYQYNIDTNPNGGGLWRKTRKPNAGSNCIGTDANRNYGAGWGFFGSSNDPCNNTFRGDTLYSEPETNAIKNFTKQIKPVTAFSIHSFSEIYLESDYNYLEKEKYFASFSLDICDLENFPYGVDSDLLYETSGTTLNFLDSLGTIAYTPEIGSTFWEPATEILFYMQKHLPSCIYITSIAGEHIEIKNVATSNKILNAGFAYHLNIELYNKGITKSANNMVIDVVNSSSNITVLNSQTTFASLQNRTSGFTNGFPIAFNIDSTANFGDTIFLQLATSANGFVYDVETFKFLVGNNKNIFYDDAENGLINFESQSNSLLQWDTTFMLQKSGNASFTDSKNEGTFNNTETFLTSKNFFDLTQTTNPYLQFWMAFALQGFASDNQSFLQEYIQFEVTTDEINWQSLQSENTNFVNNENIYEHNKNWFKECINLSNFKNDSIKFRFKLKTSIQTKPEGIYIDDINLFDLMIDTCNYNNFPSYEVIEPTCNGNNLYEIKLLNDSLISNFNFVWNTNDSLGELLNVPSGNYFVEVKNQKNNCSKNQYFNLAPIDSLNLLDDDFDGVCNLNDLCFGYNDNFDLDNNLISDYCDVCDSIKIIAGNYNNFDTIKMQVINFINSQAIINNSSNIKYTAENYINLLQPFSVNKTSYFEAKIDSCGN